MDKNEWVGLDVGESDDWLTTHMDYYYRLMMSATKIPKSRFGKLDGITDFNQVKVGDIVILNKTANDYVDKHDHVFIVTSVGIENKKYYISNGIKILDLTLKEKTGFEYYIGLNSYDVNHSKEKEREIKIKQLLNGRNTKVQQQRERTRDITRQQRNLAIPFSCD